MFNSDLKNSLLKKGSQIHIQVVFFSRRRSSSNANVRSPQQKMALKTLFAWRDAIARQEDESTGYVLPNHMLIQLANRLPREPEGTFTFSYLLFCTAVCKVSLQKKINIARLLILHNSNSLGVFEFYNSKTSN